MTRTMWTIAYRKPRANRFLRVTNWQGTWAQAVAVAQVFGAAHPELQVWYVPTLASEANGVAEDAGNVLVDTGRRVRIVEGGDELLTAEMIARVPAAEVAQERWHNGEPIADAEGVEPLAPLSQVAAEHGYELRVGERTYARAMPFEVYRAGTKVLAMNFRDAGTCRAWLKLHDRAAYVPTEADRSPAMRALVGAAANFPEQVRAWWERHGLDKRSSISAYDVLAARADDEAEAYRVAAVMTLAA